MVIVLGCLAGDALRKQDSPLKQPHRDIDSVGRDWEAPYDARGTE